MGERRNKHVAAGFSTYFNGFVLNRRSPEQEEYLGHGDVETFKAPPISPICLLCCCPFSLARYSVACKVKPPKEFNRSETSRILRACKKQEVRLWLSVSRVLRHTDDVDVGKTSSSEVLRELDIIGSVDVVR